VPSFPDPGPAGSVSEVAVGDLLARPLSHDPMPGLLDDYLAVPGSGYETARASSSTASTT